MVLVPAVMQLLGERELVAAGLARPARLPQLHIEGTPRGAPAGAAGAEREAVARLSAAVGSKRTGWGDVRTS